MELKIEHLSKQFKDKTAVAVQRQNRSKRCQPDIDPRCLGAFGGEWRRKNHAYAYDR